MLDAKEKNSNQPFKFNYMKKQKVGYAILYCLLAVVWAFLLASIFMGCNIYEKERVEIIRCPIIDADTIQIPDWEI